MWQTEGGNGQQEEVEEEEDIGVVYHSAKNNTESIVSESSRGECFISEEKK